MTITEAVLELESYKALKRYIRHLDGKIKRLDFEIKSATLDVTVTQKAVSEKVTNLTAIRDKLETKKLELCRKELVITNAIVALSDERLGLILQLYYIEGESLEKICVRMNYCYRWAKTLKTRAIQGYRALRS